MIEVTRLADARPYQAPKHVDAVALRLQGFEASSLSLFWVGLSHFLPGGGCERDASPLDKVYVVTAGEVTVITDTGETTLALYDSCFIPGGEARAIENRTAMPASMLVVMPYPAAS